MSAKHHWAPVLLVGSDYEGDYREWWCVSVAAAESIAIECADNRDAFGWIAWEIWANDAEQNDEWRAVKTWSRAEERQEVKS